MFKKAFCLVLGFVLSAPALGAMIVHDVNNPYKWMTEGRSHTVTHDLTDEGVPDDYRVVGAALRLGFSDGYFHGDWSADWARLSGEGVRGIWEVDGTHFFGYDIRWSRVRGDGIDSLNQNGLLDITITALHTRHGYNDFWWKTSKLIAKIEAVPEPGTLGLLGLGLLGLALARRRA